MFTGSFFGPVEGLYYLSFLLLVSLTFFIAWRGRRTRTRRHLRRAFFGLACSLLLWQFTLFLEARTALPAWQLWLGRVNFTAMVFAATLALLFVQEVSHRRLSRKSHRARWLLLETWLLALVTLLTPLIDAAEWVKEGHPVTQYGLAFPLYLLHVVAYLVAALVLALRRCRIAPHPAIRKQLTVIAVGMLATGGVACITNVLLPYAFGEFRYCDWGTLSTIFFLLAVAYATFMHRLFNVRKLLRATLVYGILLAFVLGTYSSIVFLLTQYLTDHAGKLMQFFVLLIAFSFDPLRRFLEKQTDHWLFGLRHEPADRPKQMRTGMRFLLALLFPWGR